jgi:RNA polymerase sigma-70 factor (ECF subfamily)
MVTRVSHRPEPDDAQLVARCRDGDPEAWSVLVRRYSAYVHAIAVRSYRLDAEDAEDVFQEVFARTYRHLESLRDDAAIRAWLGQLTRRLCVDRLRAAARTAPMADLEEVAAEEPDLDLALSVRDAMTRLPEAAREVLDRFFARDESYRTIAEALDVPAGTVASRISRALAALRTEMRANLDANGRNASAAPSSGHLPVSGAAAGRRNVMSDEPKQDERDEEVEGHMRRHGPEDPSGTRGTRDSSLNDDDTPDVEGHINRMGPEGVRGVREAEGVRRAG